MFSPPWAGPIGQRAQKTSEQLKQQIAVATFHEFGALGDQSPGAVFQELARSQPFLGHAFLAEYRDCDLAIGLAGEALVERYQRLVQPLVTREGRFLGGLFLFCEALETFLELGLC